MTGQSETVDLGKIDPDALRLNMMISSLYLFAFELLRLSIVGGVKRQFVPMGEYSTDEIDGMKDLDSKMKDLGNELGEDFGESGFQIYLNQLGEFEESVGMQFDTQENHLLLPCARWLQGNGVISDEELASVEQIRDHRNRLAHEMPKFLFQSGHDVDIDLLIRTREVLRKFDLFWFRTDIHFNLTTLDEIDTSQIPDEEVFSGRDAFLDMASIAVTEFAKQFGSDRGDPVH